MSDKTKKEDETDINPDERNANAEERVEAKRRVDPEKKLSNAPDDGDVIRDYFSFNEIFARVLSTADKELMASNLYLFWSAIGAGVALGLTFISRVIFTDASGESEALLLGNLLYPVGFLIIVLGRYQLFTENTLTPVMLLLVRLASVANTLRLWMVVLFGNMVGAIAVTALLAYFEVFSSDAREVAIKMGQKGYEADWFDLFSKSLIAGWIVATMVWLVHAARDTVSRILLIYLLMYFIGVAHFYHIITSSVEVFYLAFMSEAVSFFGLFPSFVAPVLLGNIVGGVLFVAGLNYALFSEHEDAALFKRYGERLSLKNWIFGSGLLAQSKSKPKN